jgi:hypothetical protein
MSQTPRQPPRATRSVLMSRRGGPERTDVDPEFLRSVLEQLDPGNVDADEVMRWAGHALLGISATPSSTATTNGLTIDFHRAPTPAPALVTPTCEPEPEPELDPVLPSAPAPPETAPPSRTAATAAAEAADGREEFEVGASAAMVDDWGVALSAWRRATTLSPDVALFWYYRGVAAHRRELVVEAATAIRRSHTLGHPPTQTALDILSQAQSHLVAERDALSFVRAQREAEGHMQAEHYPEAVGALLVLLLLPHPSNPHIMSGDTPPRDACHLLPGAQPGSLLAACSVRQRRTARRWRLWGGVVPVGLVSAAPPSCTGGRPPPA